MICRQRDGIATPVIILHYERLSGSKLEKYSPAAFEDRSCLIICG